MGHNRARRRFWAGWTAAVLAGLPWPVIAAPPAPPTTRPAPATQPNAELAPGVRIERTARGWTIDGTLEAALDYPRVEVQLLRDGKPITGEPSPMSGLMGLKDLDQLTAMLDGKPQGGAGEQRDSSYTAFLDTGASAHVLSKSMSERFKVEIEPDAVYHEVGLHGETPMSVTRPYAMRIKGNAEPEDENDKPQEYHAVGEKTVLQVSRAAAANPMTEMLVGEVNIVGMPAIRGFVCEINTSGGGLGGLASIKPEDFEGLDMADLAKPETLEKLTKLAAGPTVKLHRPPFAVKTELTIPLTYTNFSRRKNPHDKGPLPDLADNPVVREVRTRLGERASVGDWLLDTGAPTTLISTKQAIELGLYDTKGNALREPVFELPLGGIGGNVKPVPGFLIDELVLPTTTPGKTLTYRHVHVLVNDVSTTLDDGTTVTLDGILGTNLWFPTVSGVASGLPTGAAASAFSRVYIDGPNAKLHLQPAAP